MKKRKKIRDFLLFLLHFKVSRQDKGHFIHQQTHKFIMQIVPKPKRISKSLLSLSFLAAEREKFDMASTFKSRDGFGSHFRPPKCKYRHVSGRKQKTTLSFHSFQALWEPIFVMASCPLSLFFVFQICKTNWQKLCCLLAYPRRGRGGLAPGPCQPPGPCPWPRQQPKSATWIIKGFLVPAKKLSLSLFFFCG